MKKAHSRSRRRPSREGSPPSRRERQIVGVGASAGGVESVSAFLRALPEETGRRIVIVQHLDVRQPSLPPLILQRTTAMPVVEIADRTVLRPNHVYVGPPGNDASIQGGVFGLRSPAPETGRPAG